MDHAETQSVIHRKAQVAREDLDARVMSPSKALRLALAKSAAVLFELPLVVRTVEQVKLALDGIEAHAGDDGLLLLLDGEDGAPGAAKLDLACVMALIEVQLMGQVRKAEAVARPFTATDAAIVRPLLDAVLERFADMLEAETDHVMDRLHYGDMVENGRTLALALSAPDYDLYRLTVDFGPGAKTGVMDLYLPHCPPKPDTSSDASGNQEMAEFEEITLNAPVTLDAILERKRCPLNEVCAWVPGTVLQLSPDAVTRTRIVTAQGHEVAQVTLGQMNGFRAVRLVDNTDQDGAATAPKTLASELALEAPLDPGPVAVGALGLDVGTGSDLDLDLDQDLGAGSEVSVAAAADAQIVSLTPDPDQGLTPSTSIDPAELAAMHDAVET